MIYSRSVLIFFVQVVILIGTDSSFVLAVRKTSSSLKSVVSLSRPSIRNDISIMLRGGSKDPYIQQEYYNGGSVMPQPQGGFRNSEDGFANYNPPQLVENNFDQNVNLFKESVQERTDKWRLAQMERYANLTPQQEHNPRDEEGNLKLLSSVSKGSRALIFFILLWRDIYLFEMSDQSVKGSLRKTIIRLILTTVLVGNLAGVVISVTSPGRRHDQKKRLKAILNLDKVVETGLFLWNFSRYTVFPSKYVDREIFLAGVFHSMFFIIQCQAFTRFTWDDRVAPVSSSSAQKPLHRENVGHQLSSINYEQSCGNSQSTNIN